MHWTWDYDKNRANKQTHGLSFETAQLVFDDILAASRLDPHPDEQRWQTIGMIGNVAVIVVHTWPETEQEPGADIGRIISARKATTRERNAYEEGDF